MFCWNGLLFMICGPQVRYIRPHEMLLLLLSRFSRVRICAIPLMAAHQAPESLDSPGKNTGVGCHFLLQCMKVKSESEGAQSCPSLCDHMDCSLPGSSVHGIFQGRVPEWGAIASPPREMKGPILFFIDTMSYFCLGYEYILSCVTQSK